MGECPAVVYLMAEHVLAEHVFGCARGVTHTMHEQVLNVAHSGAIEENIEIILAKCVPQMLTDIIGPEGHVSLHNLKWSNGQPPCHERQTTEAWKGIQRSLIHDLHIAKNDWKATIKKKSYGKENEAARTALSASTTYHWIPLSTTLLRRQCIIFHMMN